MMDWSFPKQKHCVRQHHVRPKWSSVVIPFCDSQGIGWGAIFQELVSYRIEGVAVTLSIAFLSHLKKKTFHGKFLVLIE